MMTYRLKTRVIFLDIDGVLNCAKTAERYQGLYGIDAVLLKRFLSLLEKTQAVIVLSSTWRLSDEWQAVMARYGIPVHMRTPHHPGAIRGEEVDEWLRLHPQVTEYAILDDDSDFLPHQFLFKTTWQNGLTPAICKRVEQHFALYT